MVTERTRPSVAAVVVNFNGIEKTRRCLQSLLATKYASLGICVVDNGSMDDEAAVLANEFPQLDVVVHEENLGYSAALNSGVRWARKLSFDFICLLNNDTVVDPEFVEELVASRSAVGRPAIMAPMILRRDGSVWSAGGKLSWPNVAGEHIGLGGTKEDYSAGRSLDWASACALFFTPDDFDLIGEFSEDYFLYLEDIDWCLRARINNVDIRFVPSAVIYHDVSDTISRFDKRIPRYYSYRNYYIVGFRHGGLRWRVYFSLHFAFTAAKIAIRNATSRRFRNDAYYNARTRGLIDFATRRWGKGPYNHDPQAEQVRGVAGPEA